MANNNDKFISRENAKTLWGYMIDLLTGKQNKLTFDDTPTQSSDNPVKSGGIFTALAGKGTYSKPQNGIPKTDLENAVQASLGLADSALQSETDPTVPSWAKQTNKPSYTQDEVTDGSTYKRVTQTEKDTWTGKQNALSTAQMNAVDSGITSEKVTQISTNQTNILYGLNTGVKNILSLSGVQTINGITYTPQEDGTVKATGTATANAAYYLNGSNKYIPNVYGGYKFHALSNGTDNIYALVQYSNDGSQWVGENAQKTSEITVSSNYPYVNFVLMVKNGTTPNQTFAPMLCTPEAWAQSHDFQPFALPNKDLTLLESGNRAGLIDVVDSGAKNLLDISKATFGDRSKITFNADGSVTGNVTDDPRYWNWENSEFKFTLPAGTYVLYCKSTAGSNINWGVALRNSTNSAAVAINQFTGKDFAEFTLSSATELGFMGKIFDRRLYTMLCTKSAFSISSAFVPYRMPYSQALTLLNQKAPSGVADYVASGSADNLPSGCALCNSNVTNMPALTGNYFIIRTRIYDANCAEQEAVAPAGNRRFNRTKWGGTWTAWEEYTKS